jgi:hypothetical protein
MIKTTFERGPQQLTAELRQVASAGIVSSVGGVERSGSATREFGGTGCEDGRWMELLFCNPILLAICTSTFGVHGSVVVKALYHKPEGRGFDSR